MSEENVNRVQVEFTGEIKQKFEAIKKHYDIKDDADLIRILVDEKARQIINKMKTDNRLTSKPHRQVAPKTRKITRNTHAKFRLLLRG